MKRAKSKSSGVLRAIISGTLLCGVLTTPGCYGSFPLTNVLYRANGNVSNNGIIHSIIMIILVIIPVYQVCMIVDGLILNSVEFWSGDDLELAKSEELPDGSVMTLAPGLNPNEATLTHTLNGEVLMARTFHRTSSGRTLILDEEGVVISTVNRTSEGGLIMTGNGGQTEFHCTPEELSTMLASAAR